MHGYDIKHYLREVVMSQTVGFAQSSFTTGTIPSTVENSVGAGSPVNTAAPVGVGFSRDTECAGRLFGQIQGIVDTADSEKYPEILPKIIDKIKTTMRDSSVPPKEYPLEKRRAILGELKKFSDAYKGIFNKEIGMLVDGMCKQEENLLSIGSSGILKALVRTVNNGKEIDERMRLPEDNLWKMCIDQDRWSSRYDFETEMGYMNGMYNGFRIMIDNISKPLNAESLANIHDSCVRDVYGRDIDGYLKEGYRLDNERNYFRLIHGRNMSGKGFNEILERMGTTNEQEKLMLDGVEFKSIRNNDRFGIYINSDFVSEKNQYFLVSKGKSDKECREIAENELSKCNHSIEKDEDTIIHEIANLCMELERAHLFSDGNARTYGFVVINKLLIDAGLSPTILENPNHLDGFSIEEIVQEIREGQGRFQALLEPDPVSQTLQNALPV